MNGQGVGWEGGRRVRAGQCGRWQGGWGEGGAGS